MADVQHKYNEACSLFRQRHLNELTEIANTYGLRANMLRKLDLVTAHIAPSSKAESFIKRALNNSILAGEISQLAIDNASDRTLPHTTKNSIINKCQQNALGGQA
ncbi:phage regulatory CII family protein [Vibrio sp. M260112]|uniref:phage regulatory CII family protein n=1 Tax=Vibrio sp. M260112 TaxID=3020895 RepID=UPI002F40FED1